MATDLCAVKVSLVLEFKSQQFDYTLFYPKQMNTILTMFYVVYCITAIRKWNVQWVALYHVWKYHLHQTKDISDSVNNVR